MRSVTLSYWQHGGSVYSTAAIYSSIAKTRVTVGCDMSRADMQTQGSVQQADQSMLGRCQHCPALVIRTCVTVNKQCIGTGGSRGEESTAQPQSDTCYCKK